MSAPSNALQPAKAKALKGWLLEFALLAAIWGMSFLSMRLGAKVLGVFATSGLWVGESGAVGVCTSLSTGLVPFSRK